MTNCAKCGVLDSSTFNAGYDECPKCQGRLQKWCTKCNNFFSKSNFTKHKCNPPTGLLMSLVNQTWIRDTTSVMAFLQSLEDEDNEVMEYEQPKEMLVIDFEVFQQQNLNVTQPTPVSTIPQYHNVATYVTSDVVPDDTQTIWKAAIEPNMNRLQCSLLVCASNAMKTPPSFSIEGGTILLKANRKDHWLNLRGRVQSDQHKSLDFVIYNRTLVPPAVLQSRFYI